MFFTLVTVAHIIAALVLIGIVLLQHGKGASMGATFGGSSQTLFGSRGPASALAKITTGVAIVFMLTSITLSVLSAQSRESSVIPEAETPATLPTSLPENEAPAPAPAAGPVEAPAGEPVGPVDSDTSPESSGG